MHSITPDAHIARATEPALSFTNGREMWQPQRSNDYAADCLTGQVYADELVSFLQDGGTPIMFGNVMRAVIQSGRYGGVEIGFCQRIAETLSRR